MRIAIALVGLVLVFSAVRPSEAAFIRSFEISGSSFSPSFVQVDPTEHGLFEGDFANQAVFSLQNNGFYTALFEVLGPNGFSYQSPGIGFGTLDVFVGPLDLAGDYIVRAHAIGGQQIFDLTFVDAVLAPPPPPPSGVPAPGALALLGLGLFALAAHQRAS